MTRRVVLGKYNDGVTIGLRVSLPGFDALTDSSVDPGKFSFDSEWTDIAQIHQVGLISRTTSIPLPWSGGVVTIDGYTTTWSALGYKPFIENRLYTSGTIYDDYFPNGANPSFVSGSRTWIADAYPNSFYCQGGTSERQLLTIIYKIAVPSG